LPRGKAVAIREAIALAVLTVALVSTISAFADITTTYHSPSGPRSRTTGYTISNITYVPNPATPANLDRVTFTIAPTAATTIKLRLSPGGRWYHCTDSAGVVSCDTDAGAQPLTMSQLTQLAVRASS
jgi:hypothetical protein